MRRLVIGALAILGAAALNVEGQARSEKDAEASCIAEGVPSRVREGLLADIAMRPRDTRIRAHDLDMVTAAAITCMRRFDWTRDQMDAASHLFEYDMRIEASLSDLAANGLDKAEANKVFEALPESMHDALLGKRDMRPGEMELFRTGLEPLVESLDGSDGQALSKYIKARAGSGVYARELLAH